MTAFAVFCLSLFVGINLSIFQPVGADDIFIHNVRHKVLIQPTRVNEFAAGFFDIFYEILYGLFNRFELEDISYLNKLSRHIEHSELTEASLNDRAFCKPESIEEKVSRNIEYELLHKAIAKLPEIQRRRLLLYFFGEMTYEQIAALEGCTKRAVKFSVDIAIEKLKKDFGIF